MSAARDGQRRPGLADTLDLLWSAVGMRLRPRGTGSPRAVSTAVRLMYAGAAVEALTVLTILVSLGSLHGEILKHAPGYTVAQWHAYVSATIVPLVVSGAIAVLVWLWMAWANARGRNWARIVFALFFALTTYSLLNGLAHGSATYAGADLVAGTTLWLVALAVVVAIFSKPARPHYRRAGA